MKFVALYRSPGLKDDYKTIWADSINEANKIAIKYTKKGYTLISIKGDL